MFNPIDYVWQRMYEAVRDGLINHGYTLQQESDLTLGPHDPTVHFYSLPSVLGAYLDGKRSGTEFSTSDRDIRRLSLDDVVKDQPPGVVVTDFRNKKASVLMKAPAHP